MIPCKLCHVLMTQNFNELYQFCFVCRNELRGEEVCVVLPGKCISVELLFTDP